MVFLLGALCYTICTMKAHAQALEGPGEESSWHLRKPPLQALPGPGEESSWCPSLHYWTKILGKTWELYLKSMVLNCTVLEVPCKCVVNFFILCHLVLENIGCVGKMWEINRGKETPI